MKTFLAAVVVTVLLIVGMQPKSHIRHVSYVKKVTPVVHMQPVATVIPTPTPVPVAVPTPTYTGKDELMYEAGISTSDWQYVDYIVSHESSWNPDATEPTSGAHGLVQALPYSKTGCAWDDSVCQLKWGNTYATARYGGWYNACLYWQRNHNW